MMRVLGVILCSALCWVGCGDDEESSGGGGAAAQSCNDVCDAQAAAETAGDCVLLTASECKQLCGLVTECQEEFKALNECQLTGTFTCGTFSAESDADCDTEVTAYNSCGGAGGGGAGSGGGGGACTGADANGRCAQVACPCPDGEQMISAQESNGSGCACADETTCLDFCF